MRSPSSSTTSRPKHPPLRDCTDRARWQDQEPSRAEREASGARLIETQDAVILGRRSYDEWAAFWPGSEIEPFASFTNAVPKYVAPSTPLEPEWTNSRVIEGGLVDFVRDLKGQPGGDIGVQGSISVTQTLLAADVVDELRLVIAPTIVGSGQ